MPIGSLISGKSAPFTAEKIPLEPETSDLCPNCGEPLKGLFCFSCGQQHRNINRFFLSLVNEAFEDLFSPNSRTSKTLFNLMVRPGFLTNEYSAGRRARYIPPLRLYLISSFLFVLFLSLSNMLDDSDTRSVHESTRHGVIVIQDDKGVNSEYTAEDFDKDLTEQMSEFKISWLSEATNLKLRELIMVQARKAYRITLEDRSKLLDILLDLIPPTMFLLLPIFALMLKITYITSGRYYSEHLIFALHSHSFVFIALLLNRLIEVTTPIIGPVSNGIEIAVSIWIPLYLFLCLKNCFKQGIVVTLFKYLLLSMVYILLLSIAISIAMLWGILTL